MKTPHLVPLSREDSDRALETAREFSNADPERQAEMLEEGRPTGTLTEADFVEAFKMLGAHKTLADGGPTRPDRANKMFGGIMESLPPDPFLPDPIYRDIMGAYVKAHPFRELSTKVFPRADSMPEWWPPGKPPERLKPNWFYKDKDGKWRTHEGVLVSRKDRRKAGVK